jgi:hypothetical protein
MENVEDLTGTYANHAQAQSSNAVLGDFMRRMGSVTPAAQPEQQAEARQPTSPSSGRPRVYIGGAQGVLDTVGSIAADIGKGFVESPTAVVGGINDAVKNTINMVAEPANSLADWLNNHVADGRIAIPKTGSELLDDVLANPITALGKMLPDQVKPQDSVTGNIVRQGARFLTGFVPAAKALGTSAAGSIGSGAISDFVTQDPSEKGLSNLIESAPALKNPITEYLATDPNDPSALNRLRHAIEGAGFGAITEGVVRGIRYAATSKTVKSEVEMHRQKYGEAMSRDLNWLGDPEQPLVTVGKMANAEAQTVTGVPDQVAAKGVKGTSDDAASGVPIGKSGVFVNFSRMQTGDDVNAVIRDMATAFKPEINEARRGVQTNEQTKALAEQLGMSVEDLLARQKGQPFNAEQSLAARRLWATSAEKLLEAAKRAADPNAGSIDLFNFRKMMAVHQAIQSEVIAARTETARALQAWSIPAGGGIENARNIQALLDSTGGNAISTELARRVASLAGQGLPREALAEVVRRGWAATTMDAVQEAYVLGLLWSPATHVANTASNTIVAFQSVYERAIATKIGDFLGSAVDARAVNGEALAMAYGMLSSLKDAVRLGARALRTGETGLSTGSKIDIPREPAISSAAISRERMHSAADAQAFAETGMGRGIDFIGAVTRAPGNALSAGDEFFKTLAFRAEVHAQALRQATQEGVTGPELFRRMGELVNSPPEHIRLAASDAALYNTFQQKPGDWAQALMSLRSSGSLNPTFLVLPFVKTPANILRYTFERTPLAPLVKQWRDDVAAGGVRRDLAIARMGAGTAFMAVGMDLASSGLITGPGPSDPGKKEALMRQGWQPNSIYIGGKYVSFNRLDPMGMFLSFAGAVAEKMKSSENSPEDFDSWEEIIAAGTAAVSASVVNKTYFQGISQILTTIQGSEKGDSGVARFIDQQTGSLLPMSSALNSMRRFVDPVTREVNSPWDAIQAKIPGLSKNLPPARDLWGTERSPAEVYGRVYDAMSPVAVKARVVSPVDEEIERLGISVKRIEKKGIFDGGEVNFRSFPAVYDDYVRLAGNELKHPAWGLGAKDYLDAVVSGKHSMSSVYNIYSDGPDGGKAAFIRNAVSEYRKLAQQEIMGSDKYTEFKELITGRVEKKQELKMPAATR